MKKMTVWLMMGLLLFVASMVGIHAYQSHETERRLGSLETAARKQKLATDLVLEMEKIQRSTSQFRRMSEDEIAETKSKFSKNTAAQLAQLEKLEPSAEERGLLQQIIKGISNLMMVSAKLEPQLYSKDVYQKQEVRDIHAGVVATVSDLRERAVRRFSEIQAEVEQGSARSLKLLIGAAMMVLGLFVLVLVRQYYRFARPLRKLEEYVFTLRSGKTLSLPNNDQLKGVFRDVTDTLQGLSSTVATLRKERHQFLVAIANELRSPLMALQAGANLMIQAGERLNSNDRIQASDLIKRSSFRLSRTFDHLTDMIDSEYTEIRLEEQIVDIGEVTERVMRMLGGNGAQHRIQVQAPQMPIWVLVDPKRIEHVLINSLTKIIQCRPQGGQIDVSVSRSTHGAFQGVEILLQPSSTSEFASSAKGAQQDVLGHWSSENGFGVALAHKVMKAHGGSLRVAGLGDANVQFTLRLPEERVASGVVSANFRVPKSGGVQSMLADQAVDFGS